MRQSCTNTLWLIVSDAAFDRASSSETAWEVQGALCGSAGGLVRIMPVVEVRVERSAFMRTARS